MFNKIILITSALIVMSTSLFAQGTLTGEQIIRKVYERETPEDQSGELIMTLENSRGDTRVREIKQYVKDFGENEKKIMFFTAPADVRDTSFMSWTYDEDGKGDDQWIYLPALKRVKRISSSGSSDYFMGSDFTYDDLGGRSPSEDKHTLLREETLNGELCYVVESIPKDEDYIYSKTVTWVIKDKLIGLKKEFYDEDEDFLKTLTVNEYENIDGYWMILESEMFNDQKNHKTIMEMKNLKLDSGLKDRIFTERIMTRGL